MVNGIELKVFCYQDEDLDKEEMGIDVPLKERIEVENNYAKYYPESVSEGLNKIQSHPSYPKQENEHNALADARWNKKLYEFLTHL